MFGATVDAAPSRLRGRRRRACREAHAEARAAQGRVADVDARAVVADLLLDEGEAEARALAVGRLEAGEGREDPLAGGPRGARARVPAGPAGAPPGGRGGGGGGGAGPGPGGGRG